MYLSKISDVTLECLITELSRSLNSSIILNIAATPSCGFLRPSGSFGIFFTSDANRSRQVYSQEQEWQSQVQSIILYNHYVKLNKYLIGCSCPRRWWKNIPFLPHALDITDTLSWNVEVRSFSWSWSLCALEKNRDQLMFGIKSWICRLVWFQGMQNLCVVLALIMQRWEGVPSSRSATETLSPFWFAVAPLIRPTVKMALTYFCIYYLCKTHGKP